MSAAYIKGVTDNLTEAEITFDKFHAVKLVNDAVDKVRRAESKGRPELKRSRYLWLRNEPSLSAESRTQLAALTRLHLENRTCLSDPPCLPGGLQSVHLGMGRPVSRTLVQLGDPVQARSDKGGSSHHKEAQRRDPCLVRQPHRQWPDRKHQQPRAGRQGQGARLPLAAQSRCHHLLDCRQNRPQATHMK